MVRNTKEALAHSLLIGKKLISNFELQEGEEDWEVVLDRITEESN